MTSSPSVQLFPDLGIISFGFNSGAPVGDREAQHSEWETREEGKEEKTERRDWEEAQGIKCLLFKSEDLVRSSAPTWQMSVGVSISNPGTGVVEGETRGFLDFSEQP